MNTHNQTVYKILNDPNPTSYTLKTVQKFADALGVSARDLIV
jgi:hypothetical protein